MGCRQYPRMGEWVVGRRFLFHYQIQIQHLCQTRRLCQIHSFRCQSQCQTLHRSCYRTIHHLYHRSCRSPLCCSIRNRQNQYRCPYQHHQWWRYRYQIDLHRTRYHQFQSHQCGFGFLQIMGLIGLANRILKGKFMLAPDHHIKSAINIKTKSGCSDIDSRRPMQSSCRS